MSKNKDKLTFNPPQDFAQSAFIQGPMSAFKLRDVANADPDHFWRECAKVLDWHQPFKTVFEGTFEKPSWFVGGKINISHNCIGRHASQKPNDVAIIWEGEPYKEDEPEQRWITYGELAKMVEDAAKGLRALGVKKGDRVAIYMPMTPEIVVAMQACAHIGAIHSVIFAGFSAQSIFDRVVDATAKVILTASGVYRKGMMLPLYERVHEALAMGTTAVEKVVVLDRGGYQGDEEWKRIQPMMKSGRDVSWSDFISSGKKESGDYEWMDSEDPLFILYTSGTTGKPKGVVHSQAGYLLWALWTTQWVFDLNEQDLFWCTAYCGWITGHTYVTYGPLALGGRIFIYEGAPFTPHDYRYWEMIERHHVTILYTAPTAIRSFMRTDEKKIREFDLSTLRLLGSVGEPINPEVWQWYRRVIGSDRTPVVDTWWQTETGGIMIAPFPGATVLKPGSATYPLPGIAADVVDAQGVSVGLEKEGVLVVQKPWPSQARTLWGDHERFKSVYLSQYPGKYLANDFSRRDHEGYFWILGRADDVINVSGHRIGTAEVESSLVTHSDVLESAVIGIPHELKGQALAAFVVLKNPSRISPQLIEALKEHVSQGIGSFARPDKLHVVKNLPKTRSGKIMRRLLRDVAIHGEVRGDTTTLEDNVSFEVLL